MRITHGTTQYRWTPGSRTINVWTDTPYTTEQAGWPLSRWLETDVMSFGYDKPDNTTTAIDALACIINSLVDDAMGRHPAGRNTVLQDDPDLTGNCDICGNPYDIGSRFDHCGECGCCHLCCYCTDRCPACGDLPDYCQGHGPIADPVGSHILYCHDELDMHDKCHHSSPCRNAS